MVMNVVKSMFGVAYVFVRIRCNTVHNYTPLVGGVIFCSVICVEIVQCPLMCGRAARAIHQWIVFIAPTRGRRRRRRLTCDKLRRSSKWKRP